jgi:hypothetical protein
VQPVVIKSFFSVNAKYVGQLLPFFGDIGTLVKAAASSRRNGVDLANEFLLSCLSAREFSFSGVSVSHKKSS